MDWKLEFVAVPVSVVDRAKAFYVDKVGFSADQELAERGVAVSEISDLSWGRFVYFSDPDGNKWAVQQLPKRN